MSRRRQEPTATRKRGGPTTRIRLKRGQVVTVPIRRLGINGEGVGYVDRQVVFVDGALPGETVRARVTEIHPSYARAQLVRFLAPSPDRATPSCPVYDRCGGCQVQHLSYAGQLAAKKEIVREAVARYTGLADPPVRDCIGMDNPWAYRNKAQLQAVWRNGRLEVGLFEPGSHRLVPLADCPVTHPRVNEMIRVARQTLEELGIPPYDERTRTGVVRTLVARVGLATGEGQLTFVTRTDHLPRADALVKRLRERLPYVTSIMQNVNPRATPLIFGEVTRRLWGTERIEERLGPLRFWLSPRAFFQLNPEQTVKLYNVVREAAALTGTERVVDAYCGVGTIALWLAPYAREVRGMDVIPEAIDDARRNAKANGLTHVRFAVGRAEDLLPQWVREGFVPDVVVVDPPRTGLDEALLSTILTLRPPRLVYVSCNPATLAKNCKVLLDGGFRLQWIQPVDMFPHTSHVETVTLLKPVSSR
ncbi:23S rRNA (uracil(1939)-C(5))-methyltransferase RlmD [Calditerricola satsumensis]|uniref:23S rRNA (uracil(1939)-C(5))-methyltransferase RlmD n=1 Tax=Calditerricola satsumensis TaxID=373054 RepID=UPI001663C3FF|nr:23S rRNA (uracil(1939)-C(5))-methyltransferase RlmD [Calditerricola satsumensis]